jgi:hypothetical protein
MRTAILVAVALAVALTATAAAAKGPVPGIDTGPRGVRTPTGAVKYVAMGARGGGTVVRAIQVADGKVVRSRVIPGRYGLAVVTLDGSRGGLSADGKTLVLASLDRSEIRSRFAVVATGTLALRKVITLPGLYSYDAISPTGSIVYLIEYKPSEAYNVRALDVATGTLYQGVVVDKREAGEPMEGYPVTRATTSDGAWAFTLYGRDLEQAFVHALGTKDRVAVCIDLPWIVSRTALMHVRMAMSGSDLVLRDAAGRVAVVDTLNGYKVRAIRRPR